jgi:hypothetical protein
MNKKKSQDYLFFGGGGSWLLVFFYRQPPIFLVFFGARVLKCHRTGRWPRCVADFVGLDKCVVWDEIPAVATIFVFFFF